MPIMTLVVVRPQDFQWANMADTLWEDDGGFDWQ
jgi:hypothetical protein